MRSYIVAAFVFSILNAGAPALAAPTSANKATDKAMPHLEHAFNCIGKAIANGQTEGFTSCIPTSATSEAFSVNMRRAATTSSAPSESSAASSLESDVTSPTTIPVKRHNAQSDTINASIETSATASETLTAVVRRATSETLSSSTVTLSDATAEPSDVVVKRQDAALTYAAGVSASAAMSISGDASATVFANSVATGMAGAAMDVPVTVSAYASSIASGAGGMIKSVGTNTIGGASATMQVGAFATNAAYLNVDGASVSMYANPTATGAADLSMSVDASSIASGVGGMIESVGTIMIGGASATMQVGSSATNAAYLNVDGASVSMYTNPTATGVADLSTSVGLDMGGDALPTGTLQIISQLEGYIPTVTFSSSRATKTAHKNEHNAADEDDIASSATASTDLDVEEPSGMSTGGQDSDFDSDFDSDYTPELDYALGSSGADGDNDNSIDLDSDMAVSASADYDVSATMM